MKKGLTELVFIIDRSGSMAGLEGDTIGGFNAMITKQKREEGDALVSTVLFSSTHTVLHDRVPLTEIKPLTAADYIPGGCTALVDAVGRAIRHIGNVHKYIRREDRPEHTLFVIITDGMENASHEFTADGVRKRISRQKEAGWEFLFLGANMDAVETAGQMGIHRDFAATYRCDSVGTQLNYEAVCEAVSRVRCDEPLTAAWKGRIEDDLLSRMLED